ncbi:MAG: trehalase family glycosidase [Oceanicaulis sp.]
MAMSTIFLAPGADCEPCEAPTNAERALAEGLAHPPSSLFAAFYEKAALSGAFDDCKALADAVPRSDPETILAAYHADPPRGPDAFRTFVETHFELDPPTPPFAAPPAGLGLESHIDMLWGLLTRECTKGRAHCSRLALPSPFIVPGGRFTELYYWDSYFTMLGLGEAHGETKRRIVENFAHFLTTFGRIPNGARSYYLSRSQPPVFYKMVELLAPEDPPAAFARHLDALKCEHAFWMDCEGETGPGEATRRVVRLADGTLLNRFYDDLDRPRDESYGEDVALSAISDRSGPGFYRHIRAAAESGWDFSSRWFADREALHTIRTTDLVPPCLNSLLYGLERAIAAGCARAGDREGVATFSARAEARAEAIEQRLFNEQTGVYDDLVIGEESFAGNVSCATFYPLFEPVAGRVRGGETVRRACEALLKPGGLVATDTHTAEQWDSPNGWAPLHWIAVAGLDRYGEHALADTVADRFLETVETVFHETGRLMEKYNVVKRLPGGGGEYPLQDGFSWTNGVATALLRRRAGGAGPGHALRAPGGPPSKSA